MPTVAQTVLDKSHLQLDGAVLTVCPLVGKGESADNLQDNTHGQDVSQRQGDTCGLDKSRQQPEPGKQEDSRRGIQTTTQKHWGGETIEVIGHKATTTGDAIVLLFESKLLDDEDPIRRLQRHPDKDVIYVTFTSAEG